VGRDCGGARAQLVTGCARRTEERPDGTKRRGQGALARVVRPLSRMRPELLLLLVDTSRVSLMADEDRDRSLGRAQAQADKERIRMLLHMHVAVSAHPPHRLPEQSRCDRPGTLAAANCIPPCACSVFSCPLDRRRRVRCPSRTTAIGPTRAAAKCLQSRELATESRSELLLLLVDTSGVSLMADRYSEMHKSPESQRLSNVSTLAGRYDRPLPHVYGADVTFRSASPVHGSAVKFKIFRWKTYLQLPGGNPQPLRRLLSFKEGAGQERCAGLSSNSARSARLVQAGSQERELRRIYHEVKYTSIEYWT